MYGSGVMACDRWKEGLMEGRTDRHTEKVTYRCGCPTKERFVTDTATCFTHASINLG